MKKRLFNRALTCMVTLCMLVSTVVFADAPTGQISDEQFYEFDFDGSLKSTTDDGGIDTTLVPYSGNNPATPQYQTDGEHQALSLSADNTVYTYYQYYQFNTPVSLNHDKAWYVEWTAKNPAWYKFEDNTTKLAMTILSGETTSMPSFWFCDNYHMRFMSTGGNNIPDYNIFHSMQNVWATYKMKNVVDASGNSTIMVATGNGNWTAVPKTTWDYSTTDISVKNLFGGLASWNYRGLVDNVKIVADPGSYKVRKVADDKLALTTGDGSAANPYIGTVNIPYSATSVSAEDIDTYTGEAATLYSDATFSTAVDSTNVTGSYVNKLYIGLDGAYYNITTNVVPSIVKDSAQYNWDFNGTLETSDTGRSASMSLFTYNTAVVGAETVVYNQQNTMLSLTCDPNNKATTPWRIFKNDSNIKLLHDKEWTLEINQYNIFGNQKIIFACGNLTENYLTYADVKPLLHLKDGNEYKENTYGNSNVHWQFKNFVTESSNYIAARYMDGTNWSEWINFTGSTSNVLNNAYPGGQDFDIKYFFGADVAAPYNRAMNGLIDYLYVDADCDYTNTINFLCDYSEIIKDTQVENRAKALDMLAAYSNLSQQSKDYLIRGENANIAAIEDFFIYDTILGVSGNKATYITGEGTQASPLVYNANVSYAKQSLAPTDVTTVNNSPVQLYSDNTYTSEITSVNLTTSFSPVAYVKTNNRYAVINLKTVAESAAYYFDFNATVNTSDRGLQNSLLVDSWCTNKTIAFNDNNTYLDLSGNARQGTVGTESYQVFVPEKEMVLSSNKEWLVTYKYTGTLGSARAILASGNLTSNTLSFVDAKPVIWTADGGRYDWTQSGNIASTWQFKNFIDDDGNYIAARFQNGDGSWSDWAKFGAPGNEYPGNIDFTTAYIFGTQNNQWRMMDGYVDYLYIDTDVAQTSFAEFESKYINVFDGTTALTKESAKQLVEDYCMLEDASKAKLVRGEMQYITQAWSLLGQNAVLSLTNSTVVVSSLNNITNAKLVAAVYNDDNSLADVNIYDVNVAANSAEAVVIDVSRTGLQTAKIFIVDNLSTIKPLAEYITAE